MNGGNVAILIGVLMVITGIALVGARVMEAIARIRRTIASSKLVPKPAQPSSRWTDCRGDHIALELVLDDRELLLALYGQPTITR